MAAFDQPVTTYSDTAAQIRVISDYIFNLDPMDTPVVAHLGLSSARDKFRLNVMRNRGNTKVELLEDTYHPLTTTLNNGTTVSTSTLSFTVTDASSSSIGCQVGAISFALARALASNTGGIGSGGTGWLKTNSTCLSLIFASYCPDCQRSFFQTSRSV